MRAVRVRQNSEVAAGQLNDQLKLTIKLSWGLSFASYVIFDSF